MTDIQTLIHLSIEIEGLLHVLASRENDNARQLLGKKFDEYKTIIERVIGNRPVDNTDAIKPLEQVAETLSQDEVKDEEAIENEQIDETDLAVAAIERGQQEQLNNVVENDEDDDIVAIIDTEDEDEEVSQPDEQPAALESKTTPVTEVAEEPKTEPVVHTPSVATQPTTTQIVDDLAQASHNAPAPQQSETAQPVTKTVNEAAPTTEKVRVEQAISRIGARDLRRAFTLNDKFRFRRYLFDNNDAEFAKTLDHLSAMPHYAEAYNYLIEKLGWDAHNEDVKDFLSIVENHFA